MEYRIILFKISTHVWKRTGNNSQYSLDLPSEHLLTTTKHNMNNMNNNNKKNNNYNKGNNNNNKNKNKVKSVQLGQDLD